MIRPLAVLLALALPVAAQTPGNAGLNDFWLTPGGTPGGASCKSALMVTPLTMTCNLSAVAAAPYVVVLSPCPCTPCFMPMTTSACVTPLSTGCGPNQSLDIMLGCPFISLAAGNTSGTGGAAIPIFVPLVASPVKLSFQTVFLAPPACVVGPFGLLFSQAWTVAFI